MALTRNRKLMEALARSSATPALVEFFESELALEREAYENQVANEFNRARVVVMREILELLKEV